MENWSKKRVSFAKKVIKEGYKNPFYKMLAWETDKGVNLILKDDDGNYPFMSYRHGYYCIYRKNDSNLECLYVGRTESSFQGRLHRWAKGVAGKLRKDENHPAAEKARRDGVKLTDEILVKVIDWDDVVGILDAQNDEEISYYDLYNLDEWIAPLLHSKYNVITFEECGTLEEYF
jgi:hypothetical protein